MANKFAPYSTDSKCVQFINFNLVTKITASRKPYDEEITDDERDEGAAFEEPITIDIYLLNEKMHWRTIPRSYFRNVTGPLDCTEMDIAALYCSAISWSCGNMMLPQFKAMLTNTEASDFYIEDVCSISRRELLKELDRIKDSHMTTFYLDQKYGASNLKGLKLR